MTKVKPAELRCSFCEKTRHALNQHGLRKLIQGPNGVAICDACVRLCAEIVGREEQAQEVEPQSDSDTSFNAGPRERE